MNPKLMECFSHPVMCKLFLEMYAKKTVTAKQLAQTNKDIPQTTLYRYLKQMLKDGIIRVAKEVPVRGTVEKTYTLAVDLDTSIEDIILNNNGEAYMLLFMQYISGFVAAFQAYSKRDDINLQGDMGTFTTAPIYATDEELMAALQQIGQVVTGLMENKATKDRKPRNLGFMLTPPLDMTT